MKAFFEGNVLCVQAGLDPSFASKLQCLAPEATGRLWNSDARRWEFWGKSYPEVSAALGIRLDPEYAAWQRQGKPTDVEVVVGGSWSRVNPRRSGFKLPEKELEDECSFFPKGYEYADAFIAGDWDGRVKLYKAGSRTFPSGLRNRVLNVLHAKNKNIVIVEKRESLPPKKLHDWAIAFSPRDYQSDAVKKAAKEGRGIIDIATGGGKTNVGAGIIAALGVPTLFLVNSRTLLYQNVNALNAALRQPGGEFRAGIVGDGHFDLQPVTVATIQTLQHNLPSFVPPPRDQDDAGDDEGQLIVELDPEQVALLDTPKKDALRDYYGKVQCVIIDECLIKNTIICMNDGGVKNIQDIINGDSIVGGTVTNKFKKEVQKTRLIRTQFNSIQSTLTHPNLVIRKRRRDVHNNCYKDSLESDVEILPSSELLTGHYLLVPTTIDHLERTNYTENDLYFVGMILCDGHLDKNPNSYRTKLEISKEDKIFVCSNVYNRFLKEHDPMSELNIKINNRHDTTLWSNSHIVRDFLINEFNVPTGKKSNDIDINNNIFNSPLQSVKSFIRACFDCEGWVILKNKQIGLGTTSYQFATKMQLLLLKFGTMSNLVVRHRNNEKHHEIYYVKITGIDLIKFVNEINFSVKDKKEKLELLMRSPPIGTQRHYVTYHGSKYCLSKILETKDVEKPVEVYDFTSSSHLFVANGFVTHNCHHAAADQHYDAIMLSPAYYKFGLSATPYRDDGKEMKMEAAIGPIIVDVPASFLIERGYLVKPVIYFLRVPEEDYPARTKYETVYRKYVVENPIRNSFVRQVVADEVKKGSQVLVLVKHIPHGNILLKNYMPEGVPITFLEGKTKDREEILRQFREREIRVLISTPLADEGLDVPTMDAVVLAGAGKSATRCVQRVGRAIRIHDDCPDCHSTDVRVVSTFEACHCKKCHHEWAYNGKREARIYDFLDQATSGNKHWLFDHACFRKQKLLDEKFEVKDRTPGYKVRTVI